MNARGKHRLRLVTATMCLYLVEAFDVFAVLKLNTSSNAVAIPIATTDYNVSTGAARVIRTSAHTMTILSDKDTFTLSARARNATFSFTPASGDPNPGKSASDLAVRVPTYSATWVPLSTTSQVIAAGPMSDNTQTESMDYRLDSNLATDPPGTYSLSIIYTLSSP